MSEYRFFRSDPLCDRPQRIHRIRSTAAFDLQRVDFEPGVVANRQPNPLQAKFRGSDSVARNVDFVGWICGRHEDHALEVERANDFFGSAKMGDVDRIERSTEDSDTSLGRGHSRS